MCLAYLFQETRRQDKAPHSGSAGSNTSTRHLALGFPRHFRGREGQTFQNLRLSPPQPNLRVVQTLPTVALIQTTRSYLLCCWSHLQSPSSSFSVSHSDASLLSLCRRAVLWSKLCRIPGGGDLVSLSSPGHAPWPPSRLPFCLLPEPPTRARGLEA